MEIFRGNPNKNRLFAGGSGTTSRPFLVLLSVLKLTASRNSCCRLQKMFRVIIFMVVLIKLYAIRKIVCAENLVTPELDGNTVRMSRMIQKNPRHVMKAHKIFCGHQVFSKKLSLLTMIPSCVLPGCTLLLVFSLARIPIGVKHKIYVN